MTKIETTAMSNVQKTTCTLREFWRKHSANIREVTVFREPGNGYTYSQNLDPADDEDYTDLHELLSNGLSPRPSWNLVGELREDGLEWCWTGDAGQGDFTDYRNNRYWMLYVTADAGFDI